MLSFACLDAKDKEQISSCSTAADVSEGATIEVSCCKSSLDSAAINVRLENEGVERVNSNTLLECTTRLTCPSEVKLEYMDNSLVRSAEDSILGPADSNLQIINIKREISDDFPNDDNIDHMMLKDRQKMLLIRKVSGVAKPSLEDALYGMHGAFLGLLEPFKDSIIQHNGGEVNYISVCENSAVAGSSLIHQYLSPSSEYQWTESTKLQNNERTKENDKLSSSLSMPPVTNSCDRGHVVLASPSSMHSLSSTNIQIKAEPLDKSIMQSRDENPVGDFLDHMRTVKSELEDHENSYEDILDHMPLQDRMKLLTAGKVSASESGSVLTSSKPVWVKRLQKRKRTATDSVETALEEDAPGLLRVLIEKGVSVDDMRLYGEAKSEDALDDSSSEDSFGALEAVISKLYLRRNSLVKLTPVTSSKGSKASYCLACLISLVDQTQYLQRRKWPVEWGWCRDLQSFIFVFERHNRIVLERPEYGYATYFFEIVDSLPIDWQIKRLVIAMKLTSCSRVNLIENKALLVGEDLTEGEARVLKDYGWTPNTGLGTMLNYYDRVVHDRQNERESDSSEWRAKIAKLLTVGYNGGTIVTNNIPKKVVEYTGAQNLEIKLEV